MLHPGASDLYFVNIIHFNCQWFSVITGGKGLLHRYLDISKMKPGSFWMNNVGSAIKLWNPPMAPEGDITTEK